MSEANIDPQSDEARLEAHRKLHNIGLPPMPEQATEETVMITGIPVRVRAYLHPRSDTCVTAHAGVYDNPRKLIAVGDVQMLAGRYDDLEIVHQATLADRDDWRTYAKEAGAQSVQRSLHVKRLREALAKISLAEQDSTTAAADKVRDMARIAREALLAFGGAAV